MFDNSAQATLQHFPKPQQQRLLFGFLVRGMLSAKPAKLIKLQTPRCFLLIFGCGIVLPLTIPTSQMNYISHSRLTLNENKDNKIASQATSNTIFLQKKTQSPRSDLNRWPLPYQGSAPPLSYVGKISIPCSPKKNKVERETGLEPATLSLEG